MDFLHEQQAPAELLLLYQQSRVLQRFEHLYGHLTLQALPPHRFLLQILHGHSCFLQLFIQLRVLPIPLIHLQLLSHVLLILPFTLLPLLALLLLFRVLLVLQSILGVFLIELPLPLVFHRVQPLMKAPHSFLHTATTAR